MPERVPVVDDEQHLAPAMERARRRSGCDVDVANDAPSALARLARQPHSVRFSDLRMPGMDGREPLRFEPGHPDADEEGFVACPNVDPVKQMADMISATRPSRR